METIKYEYKRFVNLFMLYGLFTITLSVYSLVDSDHFYWMLPGIGMGSVFVTLSLLYYYENVLSPLLRARLDEKQAEEAQLRLQQRGGTSSVYQWFLLPLLIEFVIIAYFGITLTMPAPILGTPYTHPYQYGQIYNRVNAYFKTDTSVIQAITKPDVKMDPIDEQAEKKKLILKSIAEESFDDCLHDNKMNPSPCWQENIGLKILLPDKVHALQVVQSLVYTLPFIISISFGFIGVLFYILRDAAVRYAAKDLYYKTFVTYLTRLIFAPVLCVAVAFLFSENWLEIASPMLFFFIGYFPQRAMDVMENRANAILSTDANRKNPRPDEDLSRLQGMDISVINRLEDLGIQKAQSLAFVDLYFLEQNFNTNPRRLADLVSQALLLIYTGEHFEQLVTMGIRDMVTLQEISKFPILAEAISDLPKPVQDKINIVQSLLQSSKLRDRLQSLNAFIAMAEEREKEEFVEGMTRQLPKVGGEAETAKDSGGSPAC